MTICNFNEIKQYVLTLGGFEESTQLDLKIEMIINECLAYCYRKCVPEEMELPLADVIVSQLNKRDSLGAFDGEVTSYREGDMSINFGSATSTNGGSVKYDGKLEGFKQIIGVKKCLGKTNAR